MARRGRPRHPDILTPREWEVLALLREGLSNEQIAERLGTTLRTARFHVSEILSKLSVASRQEAAAWQPPEEPGRRRWLLVPPALSRVGWIAAAGATAVVVAGLAFLLWALLRANDGSAPREEPQRLAVGESHACVLLDGDVWCWGRNLWGSLGDGTSEDRLAPVRVTGLDGDAVALRAGSAHTCAVLREGTVQCWGYNLYGQLGDGTTGGGVQNLFSPEPVTVAGLTDVVAVDGGAEHTCALTASGDVRCWGDNSSGQLGDGTTDASATPVPVVGLSGRARAIAAGGSFTCALEDGGAVECWGSNAQGQLGATADEQCGSELFMASCSTTPLAVAGLPSGVEAIVAGTQQHVCAIAGGGDLLCWGSNAAGELGAAAAEQCAGSEACSSVPVAVSALRAPVTAAGLGANHTCAALSSGGAQCWGDNLAGQLGDGATGRLSPPVEVAGLDADVVALGAGQLHTCALTASGRVLCWGNADAGQVGDGTTGDESCSCRTEPVEVVGLPNGAATPTPGPVDTFEALDLAAGRIEAVAGADCGDDATAGRYGVPAVLDFTNDSFQTHLRLGLEAVPYDYVAAQVRPIDAASPSRGWQLSQRPNLIWSSPAGFVPPEFFLRRLDQPGLLFRYGAEECEQPDGSVPETNAPRTLELPSELPNVVLRREGDYLAAEEVLALATRPGPTVDAHAYGSHRAVWAELGNSRDFATTRDDDLQFPPLSQDPDQVLWVVVVAAGDDSGPQRPGHETGYYYQIDAVTPQVVGYGCCLDLAFAR